jgi:DNA-binding beta-propeller fold protein YncE
VSEDAQEAVSLRRWLGVVALWGLCFGSVWLLSALTDSDAVTLVLIAVAIIAIVVGTWGLVGREGLGLVGILVALGVEVAALLVAVTAVDVFQDGNGPACPASHFEPSAADALEANRAVDRGERPRREPSIDVNTRPTSLAVGEEGIWVAGRDGLLLIDAERRAKDGPIIGVGYPAFSIALAKDRIWVTRRDGYLAQVDRKTRRPIGEPVRYGVEGGEVALAADAVWINRHYEDTDDPRNGRLVRIEPCSGEVKVYNIGTELASVEAAYDSLWISDAGAKRVLRFDPLAERVIERIAAGTDPQDLASDGAGSMWVTDYENGKLWRIDARSNTASRRGVPIGEQPGGLVVAGGAVWLPAFGSERLTRVDITGGETRSDVGILKVGMDPTDITFGFGRLWIADNAEGANSVTPVIP